MIINIRRRNVLQAYITDILVQVHRGLSVFRMEKEIRNRKGRGRLLTPSITHRGNKINTAKELQDFTDAVDSELTNIMVSSRNQQEEFENSERARLEEAERIRQEQLAQGNSPSPSQTLISITPPALKSEENQTEHPHQMQHSKQQPKLDKPTEV